MDTHFHNPPNLNKSGFGKVVKPKLTKGQLKLKKKHGTPSEFAMACYATVPEFCSVEEAHAAIQKYNREWNGA